MNQTFFQEMKACVSGGNVLAQEPLSKHTTFQVGGPADLFVSPSSPKELQGALKLANQYGVPFFVVGNGSNLLVSDEGYRGMILQIGKNLSEIRIDDNIITAQAGAMNSRVARVALDHGKTGFEFAAGIPGSIGGAAAMNAGAYGGEMKDVLKEVRALTPEGEFVTLSTEEMDLSYRHSVIFDKGYLVVSVKMELHPGGQKEIQAKMDDLMGRRREKQPLEFPSAGSTFKRPEGYFAGKLIQDTGLKGYTVGGAQVSEKHSGFVINKGGATAEEIVFLMAQVQKKVHDKFGVWLEPEVRLVGFPKGTLRVK
ncbi:MAG: UDP-N-acetylmuramate dehydrogenase [Lachnospiraceae bacterium]|nr:UDP-N-acetylmuramate dehydrogenase [Lachnospiraceae bacterium]